MNQKFINLVEKTQKKGPVYQAPKTKRFSRKRSEQSDRSIDSKKSRQVGLQPCIKSIELGPVDAKLAKAKLGGGDFFEQLASSVLYSKQLQPQRQRYSRGCGQRNQMSPTRQSVQSKGKNVQYQNQALSAELQVRNKELQVMVSECQMVKQSLRGQQERRRRIQEQKKQISAQLAQKLKQVQKLQLENKKLAKEKEYLVKQIQFLEKINYDDKTRSAQSYREKYLAKELEQLRKQLQMNKSDMEKQLESQLKRLSHQKYSIETLYKALKVEKQTLIKHIEKLKHSQKHQRSLQKLQIYNSEEYSKLRNKYNFCLDSYKKLKIQYMEIQRELNRSLNSIPQHLLNSKSSLSIVLSSSSSEASPSVDKENKRLTRMSKNQELFIETLNDQTPSKNSLSPRNRQDKKESDLKKPISPVSNKKSVQFSNQFSSPEPKYKKKQVKITYFNEEYRRKIGLGRGLAQK